MPKRSYRGVIVLTMVMPIILGCTPETATRGNFVKSYQLEQINPGKDTRLSVLRILGSPTTTDPFDQNVWYYLGQKTEKHGVFDPNIVEEQAVRVTFNDKGFLDSVEHLDNGHTNIPLADRETPTRGGTEPGAIQHFLRNIGRFNKGGGGQ